MSLIEELKGLKNVELLENERLAPHTGFKTGGPCLALLIPQNRESFIECVNLLKREGARFAVLGRGSNVLVPDSGYEGYVLLTSRLNKISFSGEVVRAEAGAGLSELCAQCAERGLSGLEFAYGIPGSVGGAVFMNAGAYGGEMRQVVSDVEVLTEGGGLKRVRSGDMGFAYRGSVLQSQGGIALSARFSLYKEDKELIHSKMQELMERRKSKQPLEYPSCGSTFKRPEGAFAGKLIEDCGLRGYTVGGAAVSEMHCGFVINKGGASSEDILKLISEVQGIVREKTGYELECEIRILK
ncbi:MAG: UDP-N-acetylmuramate dehydrogenase [Oscillospiraceae bacterium]|nr:UDP-N-acetylmuramate dehydrogenase [Oscillospiraceae bacterium]